MYKHTVVNMKKKNMVSKSVSGISVKGRTISNHIYNSEIPCSSSVLKNIFIFKIYHKLLQEWASKHSCFLETFYVYNNQVAVCFYNWSKVKLKSYLVNCHLFLIHHKKIQCIFNHYSTKQKMQQMTF